MQSTLPLHRCDVYLEIRKDQVTYALSVKKVRMVVVLCVYVCVCVRPSVCPSVVCLASATVACDQVGRAGSGPNHSRITAGKQPMAVMEQVYKHPYVQGRTN